MSHYTVVYLDFLFSMPVEDYINMHQNTARLIAEQKGLIWKIWKLDRETRRGGGVYVFDDVQSAQAYVDGPIIERLRKAPGIHNFTVDIGEIISDLSAITFAPLHRSDQVTNGKD